MTSAQIVYHQVPQEVTRVSVYAWRPGGGTVPLPVAILRDGGEIVVTLSSPQSAVVVTLGRRDDEYLVDGPLGVREEVLERTLDPTWRHTIVGTSERAPESPPVLDWIAADGRAAGAWPACWWRDTSRWECMGVPLDAPGVVVGLGAGGVIAAAAMPGSTPVLRASGWGRLVLVRDQSPGPPPRLRLTAARPVSPSSRARALRLETAVVSDVRVSSVGPGEYWVAGDSSPPDAWLEIRSARSGPQYFSLTDVSHGSPQLPLAVSLEARRDLVVSVVSERGDPAPGALVTVFRLIDVTPAKTTRDQPPPRRVLAGEATAARDGVAQIDGVGDGDSEVVAWHPQFGRASVALPHGASEVIVRLRSPGVARGRVIADGKPAAGVDVISVPDPGAYVSADDPIDLKGGDTRTGADGRFSVTLAPGGGGELRVGGGSQPIVRVPLPNGTLPFVELGDIVLGRPLTVSVTLDQDPGCDLRAAGPVGRSGLQIVTGARTGPGVFTLTVPEEGSWEVVLLCGHAERALAPSVVRIARDGARDVRLTVR